MIERILLLFDKYPMDFIADISSIFPIAIGIINFKFLSKSLKVIVLFFLIHLIGDIAMTWLGLLKKNNIFILNFYPVSDTLLFTTAYFSFFRSSSIKRLILVFSVLITLICLFYFNFSTISPIGLFAYRVYAIILVLLYFNTVLSDMRVKNILTHSLFWISSGIIIYATGTFFISLFSEFIFNSNLVDDKTFDAYWNLNNVLFILLVILSSIGIGLSKYDQENSI